MPRTSTRMTGRLSVPVSVEDRGLYQAAADAMGMDLATFVRWWLRQSQPTFRMMVDAHQQGSFAPIDAFLRSATADAQRMQGELRGERAPSEGTA